MRKRAIIIGGSGQDGIEMAIFLKKKNYELISQYYQTSFFKIKDFNPL